MLKLNFHHLYYFYRIAELGQISKAARKLRIGQPALSTQLKQFEEFLGFKLFDRRRGQALSLTTPGHILYRYSKQIFKLSEEMIASAQGQKTNNKLTLRLGALDWLPKQEVSEIISRAVGDFDCFVSVFEDSTSVLKRKLSAHELDLIITNSRASHSEEPFLISRRIATLPLRVYGAKAYAKLAKQFPRSLQGQSFLLPTRHGRTRQLIEDFFQTHHLNVKIVGEAQDGELLRRAALGGRALVALVPSTVKSEVNRGDLVELGELDSASEEVWVIGSRRLLEHPIVAAILKN